MMKDEFINKLSKIIINENKKRGNPLFSSVVLGQACLETGFGSSQLMMKANAVFGIKAFESWKGKTYSSKTKEVYDNNPVTIDAKFRAYDSLEDSVADYFDLITKSERYRKATVAESPLECIKAIKEGGYATDPAYVQKIMIIINENNLTKFDNVESVDNYVYKVGQVYQTEVNLNVRKGAGTYFDKVKFDDLTPNAKEHAFSNGVLKKGTNVTCLECKKTNADIWIRIPSGWICGKYGDKVYVR